MPDANAEDHRLQKEAQYLENWKRWGPYLAERQWATVREDYSADGDVWNHFPHDHARSRAYRWGEDGLLGITDRQCRLCFGLALWNGQDPILKERLFGLTGPEGNHGEDVKECYYYLDSTPTHSWMKALYKYPQRRFPYDDLVAENARRDKSQREYELIDTGVFDDNRYFDVIAEYAKAAPNDLLIRITVVNRGPDDAPIDVIPQLWFRNTWIWGCRHEGCTVKPTIEGEDDRSVSTAHESLPRFDVRLDPESPGFQGLLFTENETNTQRLYGEPNYTPFVRDAFHRHIVNGEADAVSPHGRGARAGWWCRLNVPAGESVTLRLRMTADDDESAPGEDRDQPFAQFEDVMARRQAEADAFYEARYPRDVDDQQRQVMRQAWAGLLWSKQFYHYIVEDWLDGDPDMPSPADRRKRGRNHDWAHLFNRDVISMPDKWEYPWYATWDLAFHMVAFARIDPRFAKDQLLLLLREWYMHPNGQLPAYEFALSDVNPPVHAWACWRVYQITAPPGERDHHFLASAFQKLLINFTWWVNRKDPRGAHLFAGGFLGLDNIGVFDRSAPLPTGGHLEQADGTAWMAFYCATMLAIALELAQTDPTYEDMASKFFEHFIAIADAMNTLDGDGLWDEDDGFYYDKLRVDGRCTPLKVRSMVGLLPLIAVDVLREADINRLPGFKKRMDWFLANRRDLSRHIAYLDPKGDADDAGRRFLLAIPNRERLESALRYMLDEKEFLSPYGLRSLSQHHRRHPYVFHTQGQDFEVKYDPAESTTGMFGGNSNWRGPVWFPTNYLIIYALEQYHDFYGEDFQVECPTGSGHYLTLQEVAFELQARLGRLFTPDDQGRRPAHGDEARYARDEHWRDLPLFYEYFDAETGRGLGASHQTGWTALVNECYRHLRTSRRDAAHPAP